LTLTAEEFVREREVLQRMHRSLLSGATPVADFLSEEACEAEGPEVLDYEAMAQLPKPAVHSPPPELWHFMREAGEALCEADHEGVQKTEDLDNVTCSTCLEMLRSPNLGLGPGDAITFESWGPSPMKAALPTLKEWLALDEAVIKAQGAGLKQRMQEELAKAKEDGADEPAIVDKPLPRGGFF
jgi:hypothetical protein